MTTYKVWAMAVWLMSIWHFTGAGICPPQHNLTDFLLQREKRSLIFQERGSISLNVGPAINVDLGDPVAWRSMVYIFNLHGGQYPLPTNPIYPWDKWETLYARSLQAKLRALDKSHDDDSRVLAYATLENYINRQANSFENKIQFNLGRQCLLRAICENAQVQHHEGIFAEILNIVLTPGHTNLDHAYIDALEAGKAGVDCLAVYNKCPRGASLLDKYLNDN